jgi:uncharacterized membrane protein YbhN (UPF0104 family)
MSVDLAAMAVLGVMAAAPARCRGLARRLVGGWPRAARFADRVLDTFDEGLQGVRARRHVLPLVCWSAAIWLVLALAVWTAFRAVHLALPLTAAWAVLAFLGLGVSLPSSPGFVGVVQAVTVLALDIFGVDRAQAVSFSVLLHAAQYFPVTAYGLVLLLFEQMSLTDITRRPEAVAERVLP